MVALARSSEFERYMGSVVAVVGHINGSFCLDWPNGWSAICGSIFMISTSSSVLPRPVIPDAWQTEVSVHLQPEENASAWLEVDLDAQLRFAKNVIILTDRRVLSPDGPEKNWRSWALQPDLSLKLSDHAGVGTLELSTSAGRLAVWRFTLGLQPVVARWVAQFESQMARLGAEAQGQPLQTLLSGAVCPVCQSPMRKDEDECSQCGREDLTPPSTWTLFKLWRFAKPYQGSLLAGFVLTLAATAATLVPPYLTMPLMDDILIPYQNGKAIDPGLVSLYLLGLLGAALLAWGLGWAKTYILALVSERIGADLRTTTYEHLLKLSLEYFGDRRTGDLIARIGNETDRINVFLSLHLLDFATDVLMILMTAVILFTINPTLALVTLLPLPFIGWLIHVVRERLRTGFEKIDRVWAEVTNVLADTIPGIRVVKAFAQEDREANRFKDANRHNLMVNDRLNRVWALFSPTVTLMTEVGLLVVWGFGIWLVSDDQITVGVLTAFLAYIGRFYGRLDTMSRIVSHTQKAASGAKRIFDILDHVSSVPEPVNPLPLPQVQGRITVRDAGFRYGNRAVIRQLNLDIQPGQMIGLVGHSGSGKSTLVNLICRFYDLTEGVIELDGTDIRERMTPFDLQRDAFGRWTLVMADGVRHAPVTALRAYPVTSPEQGIALMDAEGHELLWIEDLTKLDVDVRTTVLQALNEREFLPEILRLEGVSSFATPSTWTVLTDRGVNQFLLKGEEDIRRLTGTVLLINDADGVQYMIRDLAAMDKHSRKLLDRFL
eukprot:gene22612-27581_t